MEDSKHIEDDLLLRIAQHLIINASFLPDLGLYNGKIGVAIFFFHYFRYTGDTLYYDFAEELINEIFDEIHADIIINMEDGLCGIAWGILYLLENNFIDGNPNEILLDVDTKIMERDILRIKDKSFEKGLMGILYYIDSRLKCNARRSEPSTFDSIYLENRNSILKQIKITNRPLLQDIVKNSPYFVNLINLKLGLKGGCSGIGLKLLLEKL